MAPNTLANERPFMLQLRFVFVGVGAIYSQLGCIFVYQTVLMVNKEERSIGVKNILNNFMSFELLFDLDGSQYRTGSTKISHGGMCQGRTVGLGPRDVTTRVCAICVYLYRDTWNIN